MTLLDGPDAKRLRRLRPSWVQSKAMALYLTEENVTDLLTMDDALAVIRMSSTGMPLKLASGKSPTITWAQRLAACWKIAC